MNQYGKKLLGLIMLFAAVLGGYYYGSLNQNSSGLETKFRAYPDSAHTMHFETPGLRGGRSLFFLPIECIGKSIEIVETENGEVWEQCIIPIRTSEDLIKHCSIEKEVAESFYDQGVEMSFETIIKIEEGDSDYEYSWMIGGNEFSEAFSAGIDLDTDLVGQGAVLVQGEKVELKEIIYSFAIIPKNRNLTTDESLILLGINQARSIQKKEVESKKLPFVRFISFRLVDRYDPEL